ncbi:MAG: tRNA(Ile)(2)-agmatinylcytidine synthase [Candidatus Hadarchaeales archaeon]
MNFQVGIDDTDSRKGMCTTYVAAVALSRLKKRGFSVRGFPKLIRLNPGCPYKTRGNCSVAFSLDVSESQTREVRDIVLKTVGELAEIEAEGTDPGVAFYCGSRVPDSLREFSKRAVQEIVTIDEAETLAQEIGAELYKFKLGRGIIGALAAIGNTLEKDRTYELMAYRTPENWGKPRKVDPESVVKMDSLTYPGTFDNIDPLTGEIRITPHTPCPVLYGIRGESPEILERARKILRPLEPVNRTVIFVTNQGTDEHLRRAKISEVKPYWSVIVEGKVSSAPEVIPGGHVIFRLKDDTGEIHCAAYEPTRHFRNVVKKLVPGDTVLACGGVKEKPGLPLTINLEKLAVIGLSRIFKKSNPACPTCGKRMKSEGKNKGYSCRRCKIRAPPGATRLAEVRRDLDVGAYEVPPRARRHLARPLVREFRVRMEERDH